MIDGALATGAVTGGLIAITLAALEVAKHKVNGKSKNGEHKWVVDDHNTLQRVDRWTVGHDATTLTIGEETIKQTKVLMEVRDSIKDLCRVVDK